MKTNLKKYDECAICQQKIPSDKFEGHVDKCFEKEAKKFQSLQKKRTKNPEIERKEATGRTQISRKSLDQADEPSCSTKQSAPKGEIEGNHLEAEKLYQIISKMQELIGVANSKTKEQFNQLKDQMAKMGIFDGLSAASMESLSIDTNLGPQNTLPIEQDINSPSVDFMNNLLFASNTDPYDIPDLSRLRLDDELNEDGDITDDDDIMAERADSFRKAIEDFFKKANETFEDDNATIDKPNSQEEPQIEVGPMAMLKIRKKVPHKAGYRAKRRYRARPVRQKKLLPIEDQDFFGDTDVIISNDLPLKEAESN